MKIVEKKNRSIVIDGITDREVRSRNFKGEEKKHPVTGRTVNSPGYRNFLLYDIPEDIAEELKNYGCEVKYSRVQNENDVPVPYVSIIVSYYLKPVEAYSFSNGMPTALDEAHIGLIDSMDIKNMCVELELGKEKTHLNGTKYVPLFAQKIYVEITPSYINEKFGMFSNPGAGTVMDENDDGNVPF